MADIKMEAREKSQMALTMTIPAQTIEEEYAARLNKYAKTIALKGFRKGKAPLSIVERQIGEYVREEATYDLIDRLFDEEVKKLDFESRPLPYCTPSLANEDEIRPLKKDTDITATVVYDVFPKVELGQYTGLEFEIPNVVATDEAVNKEIENLREQNSVIKEKDGAAAKGDIATVDYSELDADGKPVEGKSVSDYAFTIGSGYNRYKFDDDVTGMKTGDEKTVEKTFGESETDDELRGRTVRLSIRLTKLKERILPEVDDEFAQDVKEEYKTVQDLKDGIRKDLENHADYTVRGEKLEKVLSAVIKSSKYEIPASMERFSIDSATRDYLRQIGRSQEEIDRLMEVDDNLANMIRSMVTTGALRDLNQQIIINAIQKAGVVTVTDEEVEKAVEGRITDKTDEETAKRIREEAKDNLAFSKVPDYLIENNTFKLSGDPITPDEYMEDYYKRMSEEQAASEDAKEE